MGMSTLRVFYILAASLHAMVSLLSVGYYSKFIYDNDYPSETQSSIILRAMSLYEFVIAMLAFMQLFAPISTN